MGNRQNEKKKENENKTWLNDISDVCWNTCQEEQKSQEKSRKIQKLQQKHKKLMLKNYTAKIHWGNSKKEQRFFAIYQWCHFSVFIFPFLCSSLLFRNSESYICISICYSLPYSANDGSRILAQKSFFICFNLNERKGTRKQSG